MKGEPLFNSAAADQFLGVSDSRCDSLRGPVEVKYRAGGGGNGVTMGGLATAGKNRTEGLGIRGAVAACKVRQLVALDAEVFRSELVRGNLAVLELPDLCRAVGSDLSSVPAPWTTKARSRPSSRKTSAMSWPWAGFAMPIICSDGRPGDRRGPSVLKMVGIPSALRTGCTWATAGL